MKLKADTNGNKRCFSAKLGWKEQFDPKEIEILTAGAVPMLIPPLAVQGKKNDVILYDVSPYTTLEFYLTCILSREQFAELLLRCIETFQKMRRLYLSYKKIVLDLDKIYVLLEDQSIHFIYLPLVNSKREVSLPDFFKELIKKTKRSTYEQAEFLDACLSLIARPSSFALVEFESFVKSNVFNISGASVKANAATDSPSRSRSKEERIYHPVFKSRTSASAPHSHEVVEAADSTVLLEQSHVTRFFLVRDQTGERILISESPFLVGADPDMSYFVPGNSAVSRRHAEFTIQNGRCFISDQQSTNKTYLNSQPLAPYEPYELSNGDKLCLGNEDFTFRQED